ncbi:MAG TPA: lipid-binding SYLF domain-containing protein [Tepidisphaeraceae bacterium]|jgi:lipid-binding SYLF domain-containing protein|nr:lipid-binding SYLF domain-containing protein [Tepidisphaeraceae bacterium]
MKNTRYLLLAATLSALTLAAGCATDAPETRSDELALHHDSQAAMEKMYDRDSGLRDFVHSGYAYAIFPSVGKGGLIAGGASGRGEVFEQGRMIGYTELNQITVGAQIGGQEYAELLVFQTSNSLMNFENQEASFSANASAIALKAGASKEAHFENGIAIFTLPSGGLMAEASVGGQKFKYQPAANSDLHMSSSDGTTNNDRTYHHTTETQTQTTETHTNP